MRSTPTRSMTWMVGDDIEADIAGAQAHGMKTVLVRTGKFRPDAVEATPRAARTESSRRSRSSPTGWRSTYESRSRPDRDRAHPPRARALPALPRAVLHRGGARVLRLASESRPELRGPVRRQGSRRQGARLRRRARVRLARHRDRRTTEAVGAPERPARGVGGDGRRRLDRPLDDAFARARERCGGRRGRADVRAALHGGRDARRRAGP